MLGIVILNTGSATQGYPEEFVAENHEPYSTSILATDPSLHRACVHGPQGWTGCIATNFLESNASY